MPARYYWYNETKTIIYESFEGDWTWQEFSDCIAGAIEEIKTVDHNVMAIADYTQSGMMPMSGASLKIARDVMTLAPDNWKGIVIVSSNRLIRTMVNMFQSANRSFGSRVYLESTVEDAVKQIENLLKNHYPPKG